MAQTEQKNQNVKKQFEELQSLLERAMALQTSMVLFEWDDETLAPKGAAEHTARVIGSLSEQYQEILASMRFKLIPAQFILDIRRHKTLRFPTGHRRHLLFQSVIPYELSFTHDAFIKPFKPNHTLF